MCVINASPERILKCAACAAHSETKLGCYMTTEEMRAIEVEQLRKRYAEQRSASGLTDVQAARIGEILKEELFSGIREAIVCVLERVGEKKLSSRFRVLSPRNLILAVDHLDRCYRRPHTTCYFPGQHGFKTGYSGEVIVAVGEDDGNGGVYEYVHR